MFKAANPYDEIVNKATDENLTAENWQLNLDVCDKVSSDGEAGARNCLAAIIRRLSHRSANVQLYALTLCDALSKNAGAAAHRELASRAFTETLRRLFGDRNVHITVKRKAWAVMREWGREWGDSEEGGMLVETIDSLKAQNMAYEPEPETGPPEPSSEQLRAEDEELRRVLELSKLDTGGRAAWASEYSRDTPGAGGSSAAAGSGSSSRPQGASAPNASGYVPSPTAAQPAASFASAPHANGSSSSSRQPTAAAPAPAAPAAAVPAAPSRVRALYDFAPTEAGELAFSKGDIVRVLDSVYEHWWRGELRGEAGIFPVNYVEVLPDPTPADLQREAELEARIFAQAGNIDRLLSKLRELDPSRDNLAEDEELQELYQSSLSMRPKIVRLIDRYSVKVSELRAMNDKFVRARSSFDQAMEQSLAKYNPSAAAADYTQQRPEYAAQQQQQQQEYAAQWAQWYAANGYPAGQGAPPGQHPQQPQQQQPQQAQPPPQQAQQPQQPHPNPNDPGYAEWYYAQPSVQAAQAAQAAQAQHAEQGGHPGAAQHAAYPYAQASQAPSAQQPYQAQQPPAQGQASAPVPGGSSNAQGAGADAPHDDEKRKLFERARAEADAYHRAAQQQQQQQAGGSAGPHA